jgi:hypothetical protein
MLQTWFETVKIHETFFHEIAEFLTHLRYIPKTSPTNDLIITFQKKGKKIAKFAYSKKYGPSFHMKFYATKSYPKYFHDKVRETIEEYDFKYTGLIKGALENIGYHYQYPDGRRYFYFHREMIELGLPPLEMINDIKELLKTQDAYWTLGGE